jgi:starch phosphorylase
MVAYFSMEVAVDAAMPTYAGGLGVLAGDVVRAAADLGLPFVAVTLLHRRGYFRQRLDGAGRQREEPVAWAVERDVQPLPARVSVSIRGRRVAVRAFERRVTGAGGAAVPVYFLDTDLPENAPDDRTLSHVLYGGDAAYRLAQEVVLGIGGVRILRALGHAQIDRFHLNEGHSALLVVELLAERLRGSGRPVVDQGDVEAVRRLCVFTTHTPVPAAHDQFPLDLTADIVGAGPMDAVMHLCCYGGALNLTYLALNFSHYVNGVALRHGEVSRHLFGGYAIDAITNGVHAGTWTSEPFRALFDRYIPGWRHDHFSLRYAVGIAPHDIWDAHAAAKVRLLELVNRTQSPPFDPAVLTLGFARRAAAYKRADLLLSDVERLQAIVVRAGPLQVVYAGKAHPRDEAGKQVIERVFRAREVLRGHVAVAYLEDYDMAMAGLMTAGADVWLNTPHPPLEASGTSGMKAALNGVPSLSVLDGWWIEGHVEGVTGWAIGTDRRGATEVPADSAADAASLYDTLERQVLPLFYRDRGGFIDVMRSTIALNGSFFTAQRMLQEYLIKAYGATPTIARPPAAPRQSAPPGVPGGQSRGPGHEDPV